MDVSFALAEAAAATSFARLPSHVVESTRGAVLSTLGSALAGTAVRGCEPAIELLTAWGGKPESTVIGSSVRLPAPHAALVNAVYTQASDFDDVHESALVRPYSLVVPAALAAAERIGRISGRDYIVAVATGVDVTCRLGAAAKAGVMNWSRPSTYGTFGTAVATAKLLGLDAARTRDAIGVAYSQVSGTTQPMIERAMVKRLQPGFAVRAGVTAALLAARGISGPANALEGQNGFFNLYEDGNYDRAPIVERLGEHYRGIEVTLKAYPCAGYVEAPIEAALAVATRHDLRLEQVRGIRITVTPLAFDLGARPYPPEEGSVTVAAFGSVIYAVATALLNRSVMLANYTEQAMLDPRALKLAALTTVEPLADAQGRYMGPATVEVTTLSGGTYRATVAAVRGHPDNPLTWDEIVAKFRDCASFGSPPLERRRQDAIIERVAALDELDDVAELAALLAGSGRGR